MGLFDKKQDEILAELTELRAYKARREDLDGLQAKADELGFTGSVADLMPVGTDMATAMSGLITAFRDEVATRIETFKTEDSAETDLGDSGPDETATPTSMTAALNYVRTTYNLTGKPAVEKAREMYPKIFGGK